MHSATEWVAWRCALDDRSAREHLRVARALRTLPRVRTAFAAGELSYSKARALTRVADAESEAELLELARHATAAQLERMLGAYRRLSRAEAAEALAGRYLHCSWDEDGALRLSARIPPEEGALVLEALARARAALREAERPDLAAEHRSLENGSAEPPELQPDQPRATNADALVAICETALAAEITPLAGPERHQLAVHVDLDALAGDGAGRVHLRDGGCRFPGCDNRRWLDAHHIHHWAHGGRTDRDNLVSLCRRHHTLLHEGAYTLEGDPEGELVFRHPRGWAIPNSPASPPGDRGRLDGGAGLLTGAGEAMDLGACVDAVIAACEPDTG